LILTNCFVVLLYGVCYITFYLFSCIPFYVILAGLVLPMMRGGF
jgi:hypothetical protein